MRPTRPILCGIYAFQYLAVALSRLKCWSVCHSVPLYVGWYHAKSGSTEPHQKETTGTLNVHLYLHSLNFSHIRKLLVTTHIQPRSPASSMRPGVRPFSRITENNTTNATESSSQTIKRKLRSLVPGSAPSTGLFAKRLPYHMHGPSESSRRNSESTISTALSIGRRH
jgi:hypothetical protein